MARCKDHCANKLNIYRDIELCIIVPVQIIINLKSRQGDICFWERICYNAMRTREKFLMDLTNKIILGAVMCLCCTQGSCVQCQMISQQGEECISSTVCPCCVSCPLNDPTLCGGNCVDGYHGGKCYNRCPYNCIRCVDAEQGQRVSKCTLCKDGFYSTESLYQCQSTCSSHCKTCELNALNCTSCMDGYYLTEAKQCKSCHIGSYWNGEVCQACKPLCYYCNSSDTCFCSNGCKNGTESNARLNCNIATNNCNFGCKMNFNSSLGNSRGDICIAGNYGIECDLQCNRNCTSDGCNRTDSICHECLPGSYGDTCNKTCPFNCSHTAGCDKTTGECGSCKNGLHGIECELMCDTNCAKCLQTNGNCSACQDGFFSTSCELNCSQNCFHQTCKKTTGYCIDGCITGYMGPICDTPNPTTMANPEERVLAANPPNVVAPAVGGSLSAGLLIIIAVVFVVVLFRRRSVSTFKGNFNIINLEEYNLIKTDVLEDNDEFDPLYFTGKVGDKKKPCGKLPVRELAKFVDTHSEVFYQQEFLKLPRGLIKPCEDAKKVENIIKNRYNGIYPYDEHRVKLNPPGADFINACYIDGFKTKREYIASLGPTRKAMENFQTFWRMVWQENSDIIVMVTNLMEGQSMKCQQYWPDVGLSLCYGDVTVTSHSEDFYAEFVVRKMTLSMDREQRTLHQLHYTAWPDKRVPDDVTSLLEFRRKVKATESSLGGPIIVHCSAGIGRTGTYIALDILINQGKAQKSLDIFEWVTKMREQRTSMVQTWQQYEYLHRGLVHALTYHCEWIKQNKFKQYVDSLNEKRLKTLVKQMTKPEKPGEGEEEARVINRGYEELNREGSDIPGLRNRPYLHLGKRFGECNYINAVYINSYTVKDHFLICQTPLPNTVKDFLTLIIQESCSCIVSIDPPGLKDQTIGEYFSRTNNGAFSVPSRYFDVTTQELDKHSSYILRKLTIQNNLMSGSTQTVYHYQCLHWCQGNLVPDVSNFLQLVQDVDAMAERVSGGGSVLVHCRNAAERSGLFCAVSNLVQKMKMEGEVSVVNTLRQVKARRPLAIPNKEQIQFCYQAVQHFLTTEESVSETAIYCNV